MDQNQALEKARQFARTCYEGEAKVIEREHDKKIWEMREQAAAHGTIMSSGTVSETAKINAEKIEALSLAKLDAILEGYELHGIDVDDQMAITLCDQTIQGMNNMIDSKTSSLIPGMPAGSEALYQQLLEKNISLTADSVKTRIDRRRLMAKKTEGSAKISKVQGENARVVPDTHAGPLVLISHSSKDVELATALIDLLKAGIGLLADQIRCTSVDGYRLPVGVNTEKQLRDEVNATPVVIGLMTPSSLSSSYVMFELGARWGAGFFVAPLTAGIEAGKLSGPLSLINALSANSEAQLHQLLADIGKQLGLHPQSAASYLRNLTAVKTLADAIANTTMVTPVRVPPTKEKLRVTISAEGTPPSQVLRVVANRPVEVSRVDYMLSTEATIAGEDLSRQGGNVEIPINDALVLKLWNTPRADRNHYDHSGPAKIAVTVSVDGDIQQCIVPVQMESTIQNSTMHRKIVGSKTFYGS